MTKYHVHHIIPRHMGGTDDENNLIKLTVEEHVAAHLSLYKKYGKKEDLTAYHLLSGHLKEGFKERSRLGGLKSGARNRETGHIQRIAKNQTHQQHVANGRKGAEVCREKKINAFFDPNLRKRISALGGRAQGKINAKNGHLKNISCQYWSNVRAGVVKRNKKVWFFSDSDKKSILIKDGDSIPSGYVKGRKLKW
jgi:hypothetical protein